MQANPSKLKEKLLKALDTNHNVVDLPTVLDVLSQCEKMPVTKAALEETRIGRLVNDMRRSTDNPEIQRRSKKLIRKWLNIINAQANNNNSSSSTVPVNGERLGNRAGAGPHFPAHLQQRGSSNPVSPASRPGTPCSNNSSPGLVRPPASLRVSPKTLATSLQGSTSTPSSPALMTSTPMSTTHDAKTQFVAGLPPDTPRTHNTDNAALSRTNTASKKRRRNGDDAPSRLMPAEKKRALGNKAPNGTIKSKSSRINGSIPPDTQTNGSNFTPNQSVTSNYSRRKNANLSIRASSIGSGNVDVSSPLERLAASSVASDQSGSRTTSKTPKVKTTAQLIQDLASRKELRLEGCETVAKIQQNRICKELEEEVSIVPAGAKPRPRRTPGATLPNISDLALSKTKDEMVQKFLETSVPSNDLSGGSMHFNGVDTEETPPLGDVSAGRNNGGSGHVSLNSKRDRSPVKEVRPLKISISKKGISKQTGEESVPAEEVPLRDYTVQYLLHKHPHLASFSDEYLLDKLANDPWFFMSVAEPITSNGNEVEEAGSPPPVVVTDEDVKRLRDDKLEHVNGSYDFRQEWKPWDEVLTVQTYDNNLLTIYPYVDHTL